MDNNTATNRRVRKPLNHSAHFHGRFGATYFITICCRRRGINQLCLKGVASILFETARRYHVSQRWYLKLLLLMPDHLHMLIGVPGDVRLSNLIRDFKRITGKIAAMAKTPSQRGPSLWTMHFLENEVGYWDGND